jgi:hypothetical protein
MAAIEYNYDGWEAQVAQTNTITVLGEESDPLSVDQTIVVNVPVSKLAECVVYSANWQVLEGEDTQAQVNQPLPEILFRPAAPCAAGSELTTIFNALKDPMSSTPLADRTFKDGSNADIDCFGKVLINEVTFTGSVLDSQDLPKVAIRSIDEGSISVEDLTTTVASVDTSNTNHKAYLEGLFEQLVAADRIKKDDAAPTTSGTGNGTPAWTNSPKRPSLQIGDSLSFKVKYNFSKSRIYEVDGLDSGNGNSAAKALTLTIAGNTFTIQTGDDGKEDSEAYDKVYEFKMVAVADA